MKTTIELCKEAGFPLMSFEGVTYVSPELERLVALVRADEREACAKVCDGYVDSSSDHEAGTAMKIQDAIRARGNT